MAAGRDPAAEWVPAAGRNSALLGAMSLSGMMIKNVVVLLDEINANLSVLLMLQDVFWVSLAVTIFFKLLVGTMLTTVV